MGARDTASYQTEALANVRAVIAMGKGLGCRVDAEAFARLLAMAPFAVPNVA